MGAVAAQAMKRIPLIKFPQRHLKPSSGSASQPQSAATSTSSKTFFSGSTSNASVGGKASLQPKRAPVSNDEIEAILLGGCI